MAPLKWGIASAGRISHDFCNCLNALQPEHQITAVAARDIARVQKFAQIHKIEKFYDSYENLAKDPNVEVVYIGSINPTHYEVAKSMLQNGKHVLCEKPMTLSVADTRELTQLARERKLFLMEGMWSRFTPVYRKAKELIDSGAIGEVLSVVANFCVPIATSDRIKQKDLGGGVIVDIGIYLLQLAHFIFGADTTATHFAGHKMDTGVDDYCSMTLQYRNGRQVAHLICDGRYQMENVAFINGTNGSLKITDPFWSPMSLVAPDKTYVFDKACQSPTEMNYVNCENFCYEIRHVGDCIRRGLLESDVVPHSTSLYLAHIATEAREAVGVKYD